MTPRMNTSVNYGLWVITIFQCSFVSCNKRPTLVVDVDNAETCGGEDRGHMGTPCTFLSILL